MFATFFFVFALWSAAVPMYGTPDEPAHMVRAAGIVRGQVDGDLNEDRRYTYDVPAILNSQPGCYAFKKEATADCLVIPADVGEASVVSTGFQIFPSR